ncbi:TnsA-like heteromeric transposase endonuclease subunit [Streptomyces sp. H27-D2]|uniref:TnsA-like heteromeric transposase endonuclease subunit n=1 Tax=Streptomyces sp. H27-D2 TaxID=3046304 RepID=UPI002DBC3358|nr:TnsA-like heteromeric transposase endonuclease subunit [Streptomyces sp. H27-D2]MEC4019827.1 TnsA-like heteromeric transposase endonuclease subunit [Streptomyces sp. H27-D2]
MSEGHVWKSVPSEMLYAAEPWRTFRWYTGQKHYSGSYWSSTQADHVIYESRLELARLLYADFDRDVTGIVAQPFLLRTEVDGALRRHIPDYLLATGKGPLVVDVKPRHRVARAEHAFTFAWTREAVESRGWHYEVWSEPPEAELANLRFLAGYRRDWLFEWDLPEEECDQAVDEEPPPDRLFDPAILDEVRDRVASGHTLEAAFACLSDRPAVLVRAAVLHLLWKQRWLTDLSVPLSGPRCAWEWGPASPMTARSSRWWSSLPRRRAAKWSSGTAGDACCGWPSRNCCCPTAPASSRTGQDRPPTIRRRRQRWCWAS